MKKSIIESQHEELQNRQDSFDVIDGWPTQYCPACRQVLYERGETELPVVGKCCHCGTFIEHSTATGRYEITPINAQIDNAIDKNLISSD